MKAVVLSALVVAVPIAAVARPAASYPDGIRTAVTDEGPVFVTRTGQTLYFYTSDYPGKPACTDERFSTAKYIPQQWVYPLPGAEHWRSCIQKWPPLQASANAKPSGEWSLLVREDGTKQWTLKGRPLYTSIKDREIPGQTNGADESGFVVAKAPVDAPPGITTRKTMAGLALATEEGKILYTLKAQASCAADCLRQWRPLPAAERSVASGDWSVATNEVGYRQWAYKKRPVFTRERGDGNPDARPLAEAEAILIFVPPAPPQEVSVQPSGVGYLYADAHGRTLYAFHCNDETPRRLACDDPGDADAYYMSLCGGSERCGSSYRPLLAPPGAAPVGSLWSIGRIDPRNPMRALADSEAGVTVWMYKGRPLFTFSGDRGPRGFNGQKVLQATAYWRLVPVYGEDPANPLN